MRRLPATAAALSAGRARRWSTTTAAGAWCCRSSTATAPTWRRAAAAGWRAPAHELLAEADLVAPVPLALAAAVHRAATTRRSCWRARWRGASGRPVAPDLLHRARWTGSQAGLKAEERRKNVRRAFEVNARWAAK